MEMNIATFMYIFLHLCPLILVCFFTISSIFNNDIRGIVYLVGLIFSMGIIIILEKIDLIKKVINYLPTVTAGPICKILSFGNGELSNLSIGQMIIGFSFFYLLTTMFTGEDYMVSRNWPTITFFSLLIVTELLVNTNITELKEKIINWLSGKGFVTNNEPYQYCYHWITSLITYILAGSLGVGYALIISSFNTPDLQYFPKYKNNEKCEKVSNKTFACKVFKTGSHDSDAIHNPTANNSSVST